MPISILCENSDCRKPLRVKDELFGKRVKCPACGSAMLIPAQGPVPQPAVAVAEAPISERNRPTVDQSAIPQPQRVRWPWFVGAAVVILLLGLGGAAAFKMLGQSQTPQKPANTVRVAASQPTPEPQPKPDPKPEPQPQPNPEPNPTPKTAPQPGAKEVQWETTERLLLDAAEEKQAEGWVWVSSDGKRTAYARKQGDKQCMVVDGKPGKLYDRVSPCTRLRSIVFFGGDQHYAYQGAEGKDDDSRQCFVVDDHEDSWYWFVDTSNAYFSPTDKTWMYVAASKGKRWLVINGKQTCEVSQSPRSGEILLAGKHSLWFDLEGGEGDWYAVFDGKRQRGYASVFPNSLTLHWSGTYGYTAKDKSNDEYYIVVNGMESPKYRHANGDSLAFSLDGKHYGIRASRKNGDDLVVVDGQEYPVPGFSTETIKLSADGKHWACEVYKNSNYAVILDGKVVGSGYDHITQLGKSLTLSLDGNHLAYGAKKGEKSFVVLDGIEQPIFHEVKNITFSPDGLRMAYVGKRTKDGKEFVVADGKEGKEYDRIAGGTINYGVDGQHLAYIVHDGKEGDAGCLVIDGRERTRYNKISPLPTRTLHYGLGTFTYVAVRDGAYYWIEEHRVAVKPHPVHKQTLPHDDAGTSEVVDRLSETLAVYAVLGYTGSDKWKLTESARQALASAPHLTFEEKIAWGFDLIFLTRTDDLLKSELQLATALNEVRVTNSDLCKGYMGLYSAIYRKQLEEKETRMAHMKAEISLNNSLGEIRAKRIVRLMSMSEMDKLAASAKKLKAGFQSQLGANTDLQDAIRKLEGLALAESPDELGRSREHVKRLVGDARNASK